MERVVLMTLTVTLLVAMFFGSEASHNNRYQQQNYPYRNNFYRPQPRPRQPIYRPPQNVDPYYTGGTYTGGHSGQNNGDPLQYFRPDHGSRCPADIGLDECNRFRTRSNLVTKEEFLSEIASRNDHFNLYSIEITAESLGKCRIRYQSPNVGGTFLQQEMCFSNSNQNCKDLSLMARLVDDDCGRATLQGVNSSYEEKYYSQDLRQYFWREICDGKTASGECPNAYFFDLNVWSDERLIDSDAGNVADLSALPWGLIAADLEIIKGISTADDRFRYVEKGTECPVS